MLLPQEFRTGKECWAENLKNIRYNKINKQQNGIRTIYIKTLHMNRGSVYSDPITSRGLLVTCKV